MTMEHVCGRRRFLTLGASVLACAAPPARSFSLFAKGWEKTVDVIVVGAGAAGLAAAVSAAEHRASVLVLEKQPEIGGDTLISGGFFGAIDPERQSLIGIEDSEPLFFEQTLRNGDYVADPHLVRVLVQEASRSLQWLEEMGMKFQPGVIEIYGAHWPRCHKPILPAGTGYIQTLSANAIRRSVEIRTRCRVEEILRDGARVVGVKAQTPEGTVQFRARRGVVIASGGFGQNRELVASIRPDMKDLTSTSAPGATGEVMIAATRIGAVTRDLQYIQCLPGCPPGRTHRVRLHNDVSRFIFVDNTGRRFVREDERRDVLCSHVLALPGKLAYSITDDAGLKSYNVTIQKEAWQGIETGDAWQAASIEELAGRIGVPAAALCQTVAEYNRSVDLGADRLGRDPREMRFRIEKPPFWACYAGMSVHYTMGGLAIDTLARCLDAHGKPIPGLWAAGEVTGGIHGSNRLGANGLADAISFGRLAGQDAATSPLPGASGKN